MISRSSQNLKKRRVMWFAPTALLAITIYLWLFKGIEGAGYLVKFFVLTNFVLMFLSLIIREIREEMGSRGRSIPFFISFSYDLVIVFLLLWFGHWIFASLFALSVLFEIGTMEGHLDEEPCTKSNSDGS